MSRNEGLWLFMSDMCDRSLWNFMYPESWLITEK